MEINIRNAGSGDLDAMVEFLRELFSIESDFTFNRGKQYSGLSLMLDDCGKHRCIKLAEADGAVVGMVTAQMLISTAQGTPVALIEDMVVAAAHRGQGIGRQLMEAIEQWVHQHGASRMQLLAQRTNFAALEFYDKIGWVPTQLICLRKKWK
jgi:GNAT superfamily N-acetyltransferase